MRKSYKILLITILITALCSPIPIIIGEVYFNANWKKGAIPAFGIEAEIIVYALIGFFALALFYLLIKFFILSRNTKTLKDLSNGYLYSSIYIFILLMTISCVYFFRL
jgi:TRAP-type C4-dicarboxylate transport system permease small subunit